jgi:hypothetical protein
MFRFGQLLPTIALKMEKSYASTYSWYKIIATITTYSLKRDYWLTNLLQLILGSTNTTYSWANILQLILLLTLQTNFGDPHDGVEPTFIGLWHLLKCCLLLGDLESRLTKSTSWNHQNALTQSDDFNSENDDTLIANWLVFSFSPCAFYGHLSSLEIYSNARSANL